MCAIKGHHEASILILAPVLDQNGSPPHYHPRVFHFAFHYTPLPASDPRANGVNTSSGARLQVEVVASPDVPLDSNIHHTRPALLETLLATRNVSTTIAPHPAKNIKTPISSCEKGISTSWHLTGVYRPHSSMCLRCVSGISFSAVLPLRSHT